METWSMWSCCDIRLDSCCADPQLGSNFPDWVLWWEGVRALRLFHIEWAESPSEVTPVLVLGLMLYKVLHIEISYKSLRLGACLCFNNWFFFRYLKEDKPHGSAGGLYHFRNLIMEDSPVKFFSWSLILLRFTYSLWYCIMRELWTCIAR